MLEKSFAILFYLKKPKGYVTGAIPVYMRITVDGVPREITIKQDCELERWNRNTQRAKGTSEKSKALNHFLETLLVQVHEARRKLIETGAHITAELLRNMLKGSYERPRMILEVFVQHNSRLKALEGKEYSAATVRKYGTTLDHTRSFIRANYGQEDLDVRNLSFDFVTKFDFYLKTEKSCKHNSAIKHISNLRKIVTHCLKTGWIQKDPFLGFKMTKREVARQFLTETELRELANKTFTIERLAKVRDVFLFCCYTGLAFVDVFKLTPQNIAAGLDGMPWIFTNRQKTDTPSRIPLLPPAEEILKRYSKDPVCIAKGRVLPVLSNQKMNCYLKEIADVCSIKKTLTFHIARHTFATTITLSNGVPIESVSKMLGHKSIKVTQHYAKVVDKKIAEDMQILRGKFLQ